MKGRADILCPLRFSGNGPEAEVLVRTVSNPAKYHCVNVGLPRHILLGGILEALKRVGVKAIDVRIVDKVGFHYESDTGVSIT